MLENFASILIFKLSPPGLKCVLVSYIPTTLTLVVRCSTTGWCIWKREIHLVLGRWSPVFHAEGGSFSQTLEGKLFTLEENLKMISSSKLPVIIFSFFSDPISESTFQDSGYNYLSIKALTFIWETQQDCCNSANFTSKIHVWFSAILWGYKKVKNC